MYTLQNIKDQYYLDNETISLEEYIQEHYQKVYDSELNFLGYEEI